MYQMHRLFCATPWEMEGERRAFYEFTGKFNEREGMPRGILFVPVTLNPVQDKRPFQFDVDENIRACRHYVVLLSEDWGSAERNFENDYHLAQKCAADPALPMRSVAMLHKRQNSGMALAAGMPDPASAFSNPAEFRECLSVLFAAWLESLLNEKSDRTESARAADA
jgi:hypothetical protein